MSRCLCLQVVLSQHTYLTRVVYPRIYISKWASKINKFNVFSVPVPEVVIKTSKLILNAADAGEVSLLGQVTSSLSFNARWQLSQEGTQ